MTEDDERHGSTAGRAAHLRSGTPLCDPCRLAWNAARRERKAAAIMCAACGRTTSARSGLCRTCAQKQRWAAAQAAAIAADEFALTGGSWVPRDGIMRWEAAS